VAPVTVAPDVTSVFIVPAIAGPARLVPLPALASRAVSHDALRVAAARGRLEASKGADGTWRSSRLWVDEYLRGRGQRARSSQARTLAPSTTPEPTGEPAQIELLPRNDT